MIDRDFIREVFETIIKQKWRSLLTAFGVFWGIFILVILVGAGMGMKNGIISAFTNIPSNTLICMTGNTVLPYKGFDSGRSWKMTNSDISKLRHVLGKDLRDVAIMNFTNDQAPLPVSYADHSGSYNIAGVNPSYIKAIPHKVMAGRYINALDMEYQRNVCVIGTQIAEALFGTLDDALGKDITVDGKLYTVVGVCRSTSDKIQIGVDLSACVLLPLTLMQKTYAQGDDISVACIILTDNSDADKAKDVIVPVIKKMHDINPNDNEALTVSNVKVVIGRVNNLFSGIELLIWIVGLGTLLAGLIGISNIMMITVKERTQEIGIRRALGAEPSAILKQIMCESLLLTTASGFAGLCAGLWTLNGLRAMIGEGTGSFSNPYMPFGTAIAALLVLMLGGLFAGWIPARRALSIKAIEALGEE